MLLDHDTAVQVFLLSEIQCRKNFTIYTSDNIRSADGHKSLVHWAMDSYILPRHGHKWIYTPRSIRSTLITCMDNSLLPDGYITRDDKQPVYHSNTYVKQWILLTSYQGYIFERLYLCIDIYQHTMEYECLRQL